MILALDTSSAGGSAAVLHDGRVVAERGGDATRTHGERLPRELMVVLEEARVNLHDVTTFAVCTGPGSFTGLRVGIATIQGLAFAQRKLVVPISAFEALARTPEPSLVASWIDAHRGEVFASLHGPDRRALREPTSLSPAATLDAWLKDDLSVSAGIRFEGDGAVKYADVIRERLPHASVAAVVPLLAGTIARLADAERARAVTPHAVVPLYVRRPDAELARDRKASTTTQGKR